MKQTSLDVDEFGSGGQYRDRAKERRQKFGLDDRPVENRLKDRYMNAIVDEYVSYI